MKGKKVTYFLICCVALVWGVIFREVFLGAADDSELPVPTSAIREPYFTKVDHSKDKFSLNLNDDDPFMSFSVIEPEPLSEVSPAPLNVKLVTKPLVNWSAISYKGQIYNKTEKKHVAIVSINGKEVLLSEGEKAEGLKFIKRSGDSIKVEYQKAITYLSIK